ncbi:efflux RND transporter periplasmic adaptor subunit [Pseudoalteromonas fenneropenaei]|uniref:Efflux RND transporter periplasmic adaptor subunit n=1 Tax=Pseudoalteromonas fenneropenaei TaxID=1737459 RepID=A0ABV7CL87_9GAMM
MDVIKPRVAQSRWLKWWLVVALAIAVLWMLRSIWQSDYHQLSARQVELATVERGTLSMTVDVFGQLDSLDKQLLVSDSDAIVKHVAVRAGETVMAGDVIVELMDADLDLQVAHAEQALEAANTTYMQLQLRQQREYLADSLQQARLQGELDTTILKLQAEQKLAEAGILSQLSFAQTRSTVENLQRQLQGETKRLTQLKVIHQNELQLAKRLVTLQEKALRRNRDKLAALTVVAPITAVIETLPLVVGQKLHAGELLATLGQREQLKAMLQVPQSQLGKIQLQQPVSVVIQGQRVAGKVSRITPVVQDNYIVVEVTLADVPVGAVAKQSVTAKITVATWPNTVHVRSPASVEGQLSGEALRVSHDGLIERVSVQFADLSGGQVRVVAGLAVGDRIVVSDLSAQLAEYDKLILKE